MEKTITLNTKGYDGFIDFIKAYAIICVLIGHTLPPYILDNIGYCIWCGMQVPLFILIQVFHCFKKEHATFSIVKVLNRVVYPFLIIESLTFIVAFVFAGTGFKPLIHTLLTGGGYGPGSYYPWIYLQVAVILPLVGDVLKKYNKALLFVIFILVGELFETLFSLINLPSFIYRLLAVRYLFLIYLGWLWVQEGIVINWKTMILSVISLAAIIYFNYYAINDEPFFFTTSWKYHRWPCYFFVAYGFIPWLRLLWKFLNRNVIILRCIKKVAGCSYEIFLVQMSSIFLFQENLLSSIGDPLMQYFVWLTIIWILSIGGGVMLNIMMKKGKIYNVFRK